jgi:tetratricopeptide (TPR) repeat protein
MSDWFYNTLNRLTFWLTLGCLFALAVLSSSIEIKDLDLWLHLRTGQFILDHHQIPTTDIFSFTIAGKPWINHEWLFQAFAFGVYSLFGFAGLIQMQTLIVILTLFLLVVMVLDHKKMALTTLGIFLVIMVYQTRFTIRPDLFSLLFLTIYLYTIFKHIDSKESYFVIGVIQLLWTNMHGFFMMGPILLLICFVAETIKKSVPLPWDWKNVDPFPDKLRIRLLKLFLISLLVSFLNPHGIQGVLYPLKVLFSVGGESKVFFKHILELQSPINLQSLFSVDEYIELKWLILLSAISFILSYRKINLVILMIWTLFLVFSLKAVRNIPFFAFISYITIVYNASKVDLNLILPPYMNSLKIRTFFSVALQVTVIIWTLTYIQKVSFNGYYDFDKFVRKSEFGGVSLRNFPHKATDFLVRNDIKGEFFNDFNSGAYLIGRAYPNIRVFIDGRTEMYGAEFFEKYRRAFEGDNNILKEDIAKYQPTGAFLNAVQSPPPEDVLQFFYNSGDWSLIYFDYDAVIFLRNISSNKEWIDKFKLDLSSWKVDHVNLLRMGAMDVVPYEQNHRATNFYSLGLFDLARQEALEALRVDPRSHTPYKILGLIYLSENNLPLAFEHLRKAKLLNPTDTEIRLNLGVCLYRMGEVKKAEEQLQRAVETSGGNAKVLSYYALIEAKEKKFSQAMDLIRDINFMPPKALQACLELAEIFKNNKKYDEAKKVYETILRLNPENTDVKKKLEDLNKL